MNSALQCLSNTEDLTKYFLSGTFKKEINLYSGFGSKGILSNAYEELINSLWNTRLPSANPLSFKISLYTRTNRFGDSSMQDSQEMLNILLDHLHEDVNRINSKPYFEMIAQKPNETDEEASERWWNCHKKREDSIIVDIFNGQFKSVTTCSSCNVKSIGYDPFLFLSLPIPIGTNKYRYIFIRLTQECLLKEINYSSNCSISQIKVNIATILQMKIEQVEAIIFDKDRNPIEIGRDSILIKTLIDEEREVVFYEKDTSSNTFMLYVYPIVFTKSGFFSFFFNPIQRITYLSFPFAYAINSSTTLAEVCFSVFQSILHILNEKSLVNIQEILLSPQMDMKTKKRLLPFTLHLLHQVSNKIIGKSYKCHLCVDKNVPYCNIFDHFDLNAPVSKIIRPSWNSPSFILVEIPSYDQTKRIFQEYPMPLQERFSSKLLSKSRNYSIQDCFELFTVEEKLGKENQWYCNVCKKHEEAKKKLDIYKAPNYLIVHLKRFKTAKTSKSNEKNGDFVSYPVDGLNLQDYVIGPQAKNAVYDLYGVVKHMGTLNDGHYTALCKNFDQWFEFNDDKVVKIQLKSVINENAYLLFYKKRK